MWDHIIFYFHATNQRHSKKGNHVLCLHRLLSHPHSLPTSNQDAALSRTMDRYQLSIFHTTRLHIYAYVHTNPSFYVVLSLSVIFFTSFGLCVIFFYFFWVVYDTSFLILLPRAALSYSHNLKWHTSFYYEKMSAKAKLMMTLFVSLLEVFCCHAHCMGNIT